MGHDQATLQECQLLLNQDLLALRRCGVSLWITEVPNHRSFQLHDGVDMMCSSLFGTRLDH
jgi:hypothetical protein